MGAGECVLLVPPCVVDRLSRNPHVPFVTILYVLIHHHRKGQAAKTGNRWPPGITDSMGFPFASLRKILFHYRDCLFLNCIVYS